MCFNLIFHIASIFPLNSRDIETVDSQRKPLVPAEQNDMILSAMSHISTSLDGCVSFVPRTSEMEFVNITNEFDGCRANVGKRFVGFHGGRGQRVNLAPSCFVSLLLSFQFYMDIQQT